MLVGHLYDEHSANARGAISPDGVLSYYVDPARGSFLVAVTASVALWSDLKALTSLTFTTSFDHLKRSTYERHLDSLAAEDSQVGQAWDLVVGLVHEA